MLKAPHWLTSITPRIGARNNACAQPAGGYSVLTSTARQFVIQGDVAVALWSVWTLLSGIAIPRVVERPHHEMAIGIRVAQRKTRS